MAEQTLGLDLLCLNTVQAMDESTLVCSCSLSGQLDSVWLKMCVMESRCGEVDYELKGVRFFARLAVAAAAPLCNVLPSICAKSTPDTLGLKRFSDLGMASIWSGCDLDLDTSATYTRS